MKYRQIRVVWMDHHESEDTWAKPTPEDKLEPATVESIGWLLGENDIMLEMTSHLSRDQDDNTQGRPMRIVKAAILYRSDKPKISPKRSPK